MTPVQDNWNVTVLYWPFRFKLLLADPGVKLGDVYAMEDLQEVCRLEAHESVGVKVPHFFCSWSCGPRSR